MGVAAAQLGSALSCMFLAAVTSDSQGHLSGQLALCALVLFTASGGGQSTIGGSRLCFFIIDF